MASVDGRGDFDALYARYRGLVRRTVRSRLRNPQSAEEAENSTFARLSQIQHKIPTPDDEAERYIVTVAVRTAIDIARREVRQPAPVDPALLPMMSHGAAPLCGQPDVALLRSELRARVIGALSGLQPTHRKALYLHLVEGVSYEEVARSEGVSARSLRESAIRARRRLTHVLDGARDGVPAVVVAASRRLRELSQQVRGPASDWTARVGECAVGYPIALAASLVFAVTVTTPEQSSGPITPHAGVGWSGIATAQTVSTASTGAPTKVSPVVGRAPEARPTTSHHLRGPFASTEASARPESTGYSSRAAVETDPGDGEPTGARLWGSETLPPCESQLGGVYCQARAVLLVP